MEIPVYLFTGFLESGKTTFIQETLEDPYFNDGEVTLVLVCEEGEAELDPARFAGNRVFVENLSEPEKLSKRRLKSLERMYSPEKIIIEYNGMWKLEDLIRSTPDNWELYQNMMFAESQTFLNYSANMRELVGDKLKLCDAVVFNRFSENMDKTEFHRVVRAFNRRADIMYEYSSGRVEPDDIPDPLPYDMEAEVICVEDEDYAVWYRDINEETQNYEEKTLRIKGRVLTGGGLPKDCFILGRHVMTCCEADIEFCGVVCRAMGNGAADFLKTLEKGDWVILEAVVTEEVHKTYGGEAGPVLNVYEIGKAEEPEEEVAVFY